MVNRINPSVIIVKGKIIKGMTGNIICVDFSVTFEINKNYEQMTLFKLNKLQLIESEVY